MYDDTNKLIVFQKAHQLVLYIYNLTKRFLADERFGLSSQIRRAAVSIPSNIVEGKGRGSSKEFIRFLLISRGSLEEVKYQILLAKDLGYIHEVDYNNVKVMTNEVGRLLNGLIKSVKSNQQTN